jgi:hypothetical protein
MLFFGFGLVRTLASFAPHAHNDDDDDDEYGMGFI